MRTEQHLLARIAKLAHLKETDWGGTFERGPGTDRYQLGKETGWAHLMIDIHGETVYQQHGMHSSNDSYIVRLASRPGDQTLASQVFLIRWGERRYLVFESQFNDFMDAVNSGMEPRSTHSGRFYLRLGDEQKPFSGVPGLIRYQGDEH